MKYWAFLSYSHADKKWGGWLHKALETYRVPRRLVGTESRDGKVPPRLFPIFRDREELPVSADLGSNINEALQESRYLVVICSPRAAQSRWVAEEIKTFKKLRRGNRILALIVDGEPNASDGKAGFAVEDECFPAPMRYRLAENGELSQERTEPIAADARESGDGKNNAKLKLLAGLLGVSYDNLKRRDQDRRLRRARAIGSAALVLVLIFAALAVALLFKEREAQRARMAAVEAEQQTKLRASRADADIGVQLAGHGDEAGAFAHAIRALELNPKNTIAAILAYRLLGDGPLALPAHLLAHSSVVRALAFSRDGRRLATGCDDGSIMVVDLDTGDRLNLSDKPLASVVKLAFSPDSKSIAFATTGEGVTGERGKKPTVRAWEYTSPNKPVLVSEKFNWEVLELAWPLPDRIVVHSGREWGSGERMTQVFGLTNTAWDLTFGIGDWGELGMGEIGDIGGGELGDIGGDEPVPPRFVQTGNVQSWVIDMTGMLVVHDKMKRRLSWLDLHGTPDINKPLFVVNTLHHEIVDVAEQIGVAILGINFTEKLEWRRSYMDGIQPKPQSVLEWADPRSRQQGTIPVPENTLVDRVSANGERILCLKGDAAVILDRRTGKEVGSLPMQTSNWRNFLAFSQDGNSVVLRAESNRAVIGESSGKDNGLHATSVSVPAQVSDANLDSSGKWLAISSDDKDVRVWARAALQQRPLSLSKSQSTNQAKADIDQSLLSKTNTNTDYQLNVTEDREKGNHFDICRVDPKTSQCTYLSSLQTPESVLQLLREEAKEVTGYSFSPDGARVAVTYGIWSTRPDQNLPSVAVLYDTATGRVIGKPLQHDDDVFSPCYSPDGKWFITICDDRTVRRWDGHTGASMGAPIRVPNQRRIAQVSPNGNLVVTGGGDIIDAGSWQVIKELTPEPTELTNAFFSPDGSWLATTSILFKSDDLATGYLMSLNQWDLQNAVQIAESIKITLTEGENSETRWLEPGRSVAVGTDVVWQCIMPCSIESILPFLQACRPLILGEEGEQIINPNCSLDSVNLKSFFPEGRTEQNQAAYDFAERVLTRGLSGAQNTTESPPWSSDLYKRTSSFTFTRVSDWSLK
jgi:WD40 repeat protein